MHIAVIRDVRLMGEKPKGDSVLEVNFDTPLSWPILWLGNLSDAHGGDVFLKIMAHGGEVGPGGIKSQGGFGVQFCKEWIQLGTLWMFAPLKGKLKGIDLLSCGAAYITPGCEGKQGDGNLLCFRFAQVTGATVRASTATQQYLEHGKYVSSHDPLDFGPWEGTVLTYGPSGAVVKVEQAPAN